MNDNIQIGVSLSPGEYRAWARIAELKGTQVHRLLETLARRALNPNAVPAGHTSTCKCPERISAEVKRIHAEGLTDVAIAGRLGISDHTVRKYRHDLDLPKNTTRGRKRSVNVPTPTEES